MVRIDTSNIFPFVDRSAYEAMEPEILSAHNTLESGSGAGSDFLGWVRLPEKYDRGEFARIKKAAAKIKSDSGVLVVIGIGGSYLGARAAIEFLRSPNYNLIKKDTPDNILKEMEGRVWGARVPEHILPILQEKYRIGNIIRRMDGIEIRVVSDEKPLPDAMPEPPRLEDMYLYYFDEEE
jgi:hypothetical protein